MRFHIVPLHFQIGRQLSVLYAQRLRYNAVTADLFGMGQPFVHLHDLRIQFPADLAGLPDLLRTILAFLRICILFFQPQ